MAEEYRALDDGEVQGSGWRRSTRFRMTEEYRVLDDGGVQDSG